MHPHGSHTWLLAGIVLCAVGAFVCRDEVAYLARGRDAQADITKTTETKGRRGRVRLTVEYTFTDANGTRRTGSDTVSGSAGAPRAGKVDMRYAGSRSRLSGHLPWAGFLALGLGLMALGVFAVLHLRGGTHPMHV
jgi:hypothetical protein